MFVCLTTCCRFAVIHFVFNLNSVQFFLWARINLFYSSSKHKWLNQRCGRRNKFEMMRICFWKYIYKSMTHILWEINLMGWIIRPRDLSQKLEQFWEGQNFCDSHILLTETLSITYLFVSQLIFFHLQGISWFISRKQFGEKNQKSKQWIMMS